MRTLAAAISLCLCAQVALAQVEDERQLDWGILRQQGCLTHGVIVDPDSATSFESLRIASGGGQEMLIEVLVLEDPDITTGEFELRGKLRHEGVSGSAYLELWAQFAEGKLVRAATDSLDGPGRRLEGTSGWREFALQMRAPADLGAPDRLVLSVGLPGAGTVWLGPLTLVAHPSGWRGSARSYAWWIASAATVVLGLAVDALLLGLACKGRARGTVTATLVGLTIAGACLLAAGALAAVLRKATGASAQTIVVGLLVLVPAGWGLVWARRRYDQSELRRMDAMDAV